MIRKIIHIDEEKCTGCGLCAQACHEGAIDMVNGKAKLMRDNFCDGFGDCLPACPANAITFIEREAAAYDEAAVAASKASKTENAGVRPIAVPLPQEQSAPQHAGGGCPGSRARSIEHSENTTQCSAAKTTTQAPTVPSWLNNWPVQIKLAPLQAPYFDGANLLIAADCCAYSYGNFHNDFIKGNMCLIGCSKLDDVNYTDKLASIIKLNDIKKITVTRMEVPCCSGLENMARLALQESSKNIPFDVVVFSLDGRIIS